MYSFIQTYITNISNFIVIIEFDYTFKLIRKIIIHF